MSTGSLILYQWIITAYLNIVDSYEQYNNESLFWIITLDYAIPVPEAKKDTGKLSTVVTYNTRYINSNEISMELYFGIGEDICVNVIIGLPTFRKWKLVLDIYDGQVTSKYVGVYFDVCFQHAVSSFPEVVSTDKRDFSRNTH